MKYFLTRGVESWMTLLAGVAIGVVIAVGSASSAQDVPKNESQDKQTQHSDLQLDGKLKNVPAVKTEYANETEAYCANIVDAARDQRYLLQKKELGELQAQVNERIKLLEKRRDEYQEWLEKREDFLRVAEGTLITIYKKMKPDAAATQLALVKPEIAAAVIMKLDARMSSSIFNEMDAEKAAMLAGIIADAASREIPKEPS